MMCRRLLLVSPLLVLALAAASAQASPSSLAGKIVYSSDWGDNVHNPELYSIRVSGSGRRNLTRNPGAEGGFVRSPTGGGIAFWAERFGADGVLRGLHVMRADGSGQRRLTPSGMLVNSAPPTWSPDGRRLAFSAHYEGVDGIWIVRTDGRDLRLLAEGGSQAVWAPRGTRVAFVAEGAIDVVDADEGGRRRLTDGASDSWPAWSPDARALAFIRLTLTGGHPRALYRVATAGGLPQQLVAAGDDFLREPTWSPRRATIAFTRMRGDGRTMIETVRATGGRPRSLGHGEMPAWSPDGQRIAFATASSIHAEPPSIVGVMNADGSGRRKVGDEKLAIITSGPSWSRDGKALLFGSLRGSADHELFVIAAGGSGRRQLTRNAVEDVLPAWSPARRRIAFARFAGRVPSVWVMDATGAKQQRLSPGTHPSWSPEGSRLAFERDGSVFLMSDRGRNARLLAQGGRPVWAPRGGSIAFVRGTELFVVDAETRALRSLADLACEGESDTNVESPEWSPDAGRLVVPVGCDYGKVSYRLAVLVDAGGGLAGELEIDLALSRLAWSPDGSRIAFARVDEYPRLATTLLDGTARTTVTSGPADDRDPDW